MTATRNPSKNHETGRREENNLPVVSFHIYRTKHKFMDCHSFHSAMKLLHVL